MPLRIGIIGMGGFAGVHHDAVLALEAEGVYRLVCTCDPNMAAFSERQSALRFTERGVRLFTDYVEMLDACRGELDLVTIPTPIPLHAPMHRACVEHDLPVYLEKPPTLDWAELEEMLAVESHAQHLTNVGFNYIIEPQRQALKQRLTAGEFGAVRQVHVCARWPRDSRYYARAPWAGRLSLDGRLVLDSPMGNAMAHHVHNALYWCGQQDHWAWGEIDSVTAELYRAHAIEGMDTVFLTANMTDGVELRLAMSHACAGMQEHEECVICDDAVITCTPEWAPVAYHCYTVAWRNGHVEHGREPMAPLFSDNLRAYGRYLRGELHRPMTRLVDSRPFVMLNNLAYLAAGEIVSLPEDAVTRIPATDTVGALVAINGLAPTMDRFLRDGAFPSTQQAFGSWGGTATPADLPRLQAVVQGMVGAATLL